MEQQAVVIQLFHLSSDFCINHGSTYLKVLVKANDTGWGVSQWQEVWQGEPEPELSEDQYPHHWRHVSMSCPWLQRDSYIMATWGEGENHRQSQLGEGSQSASQRCSKQTLQWAVSETTARKTAIAETKPQCPQHSTWRANPLGCSSPLVQLLVSGYAPPPVAM